MCSGYTESPGTRAIKLYAKLHLFIRSDDIRCFDLDDVFSRLKIVNFIFDIKEALAQATLFFLSLLDVNHVSGNKDVGSNFFRTAVEAGIDVFDHQETFAIISVFDTFFAAPVGI